jgi:AraC-like DNA-binding protein
LPYAAIRLLSSFYQQSDPLILVPKNNSMKLFIKYMVSIRCKMLVKAELERLGLHYTTVELGEVNIVEDITPEQRDQLNRVLKKAGLELMDDKKAMLVEKIKNVIIELIHYSDEPPLTKYSVFLCEKLNYDYTYLANLFSEVRGITIEQFIIIHKIERVKELLVYDDLNLTQIAEKLHYSSVGHLSNQFKKTTGLTPSHFKKLKKKRLSNLENL